MYKGRIKKPIDILKQPWLDFERLISLGIYKLIKSRVKSRNCPDELKKILLIRRNRLGDAVNILPIIEGIKQCQPDTQIHVLGNQYNAVVFEYSGAVDKVHVINEKWLLGKLTLFMHPVLLQLREENFDLVIGVGGYSSVLAQLVFWIKGQYNVGPVSKKGTFYDLVFDLGIAESFDRDSKHHVDDMAHIVRQTRLNLPEKLPYTKLLRPRPACPGWLALCPDVKRKESRYPLSYYQQLVEILLVNHEVERILLFTESPASEYRQLENFGAQWQATSNVEDFIESISVCQWAITAEGGGAHIAGALGLGLVVISGMGHQNYWRPYAEQVRVLDVKNAVSQIPPEAVAAEFRGLKQQSPI